MKSEEFFDISEFRGSTSRYIVISIYRYFGNPNYEL